MLGKPLYDKLHAPEFRPFTVVLANGDTIPIKHRDSIQLSSVEHRGTRYYSSYVQILESRDDAVIDRSVSLAMIAQLVDTLPMPGQN